MYDTMFQLEIIQCSVTAYYCKLATWKEKLNNHLKDISILDAEDDISRLSKLAELNKEAS